MADRMITYALGVLTGSVATIVACFAIVGYRHTPPRSVVVDVEWWPCWCRRRMVQVTVRDIATLRTESCGRPDCHGPIDRTKEKMRHGH